MTDPYSWSDDPLFPDQFARDLSAQVAQYGGQVPTAHGPEPEDLLRGSDDRPSEGRWQSRLETRCEAEHVQWNLHGQPMVLVCTYPWWHKGDHGTEIPELYQEWDRIAREIAERKRA